jgi:hypothetical protein
MEGGRTVTKPALPTAKAPNGHLFLKPRFLQTVFDELEVLELKEANNVEFVYGEVRDDTGGGIVA